ncbi:Hypothetical protein PSEBR_m432 [Pseudomonas brassicacearum subsp. brassicacearum NFM421]|uniref:Uncharacterized protein n=1 Tax=Pseudomonas brassicacearum (strain NFM421) TaxID=994484 RepID=F2KE10_PSEBN|nr:Hypothetical protein PSEBR_m432 [Pseudomonas brassicacearum subsp. brassicacearum NFM421]
MIVVDVLMISCHVSLKSKSGPLRAQSANNTMAPRNVLGLPAQRASFCAIFAKVIAVFLMDAPVWCDSNETVKILLTFSGAAVRQGFSCSLKIIATNCRVGGSLLKALSFGVHHEPRTHCLPCLLFVCPARLLRQLG